MTFLTKKHLSRRAALRGLGVTLSLPLLDSMVPAQTPLAKTAANPKVKLALCYIPHGAVMANWTPAAQGAISEMPRTLASLAPFRDQVVVVSNLAHAQAAPGGPGDNGGDHTRSPAVYLNGVHPKRTDGADIRAGVTIDQIAAAQIGQETPIPSMELAIEDFSGLVGSCDVGFSCAYMNTISWRTPTTPLPMEINPRTVFHRMFGDGATAEERKERIEQQRSILDAVTGQTRKLEMQLGASDRNRVGEYLEAVREVERRIQLAEKQTQSGSADVPESPAGIPEQHDAHTKLMFDLMALAFQTDLTRIATFMMAREVSYRTFPMLGIAEGFHPTSHHQNSPERLESLTKINAYHVGLAAHFLERLKATPDGDGSLLDHTLVLYGSGMSNSNIHNHSPLPVFVAGGAAGRMKGGRHLLYPENTPMSNLLLTILQKSGVNVEQVGDSTGPLTEL
jgi:hypothetical protein